jgi:epoxyqueuosine reductase QueG
MLTTQDVKKAAHEYGADLVGIGSVDRWNGSPAENDPRTIMPNARSVICLGFRVHRGSFRACLAHLEKREKLTHKFNYPFAVIPASI